MSKGQKLSFCRPFPTLSPFPSKILCTSLHKLILSKKALKKVKKNKEDWDVYVIQPIWQKKKIHQVFFIFFQGRTIVKHLSFYKKNTQFCSVMQFIPSAHLVNPLSTVSDSGWRKNWIIKVKNKEKKSFSHVFSNVIAKRKLYRIYEK